MSLNVVISEKSSQTVTRISERCGLSISKVLDEAIENYRRQKFLEETDRAFAALKTDADAWRTEQTERDLWEQTLTDGVNG